MTNLELMQSKFDETKKSVDSLQAEIEGLQAQRTALIDRGMATGGEIETLEAEISKTLMTGGDIGALGMTLAALKAEAGACLTVGAQLDAKIADAQQALAIRHNNINRASSQLLQAEYAETVQAYGEGIKALLPLVNRLLEIAPLIGTSLTPGQGWLINPRTRYVGNVPFTH